MRPPLADRGLATETRDLTERGLVDAIIASGDYTGAATSLEDIKIVRQHTTLPLLVGSGATLENLPHVYAHVDGLIVGSYFKQARRRTWWRKPASKCLLRR
jgi:predicted TIM-barrel enzyme